MGIMSRLIKILKADVHGVMDQFEDKGLLLKQHLRDMEEALRVKETELNKLTASQSRLCHDREKFKQQCHTLEQDLNMAVQKDKDDIARMLIRKIKPLANLKAELEHHIETLDQKMIGFKDVLDRQRIQHEQIKHKACEYFQKTEMQAREPLPATVIPSDIAGELTEAEVELELLHIKEHLKGGAAA